MKTGTTSRKRFYKPWHFLSQAGKRPLRILWEVFDHYHLDELKQELHAGSGVLYVTIIVRIARAVHGKT